MEIAGRRRFLLAATLLLAATAIVYLPVVFADFAWDDQGQILANADNLRLSRIPAFFLTDVWSMTEQENIVRPPYYRPLFMTSLTVDHVLFGLSAWGYHLHSLLWHLAAVVALLVLLKQVLPPIPSLVGAALFALHPVQSESVCWISGRADPMAATFVFLAVTALAPRAPGRGRAAAGTLAMLGALFSKEPAVVAPVLLLAVDWARFGRPGPWRRYAWLGGVIVLWAVLHLRAAAGTGLPPGRLEALWPKLLDVFGLYGRLLLWPYPLTTGRHLLYFEPPAWQSFLGILGALGLAAWLVFRGGRVSAASLAWAALTFLPSIYAMAGSYQLGERYLYLSMAGVGLAVGWAMRKTPPSRLALASVPFVLASLWVVQGRLPDWKNGLTLTQNEVRVAPNPYTWGGHGLELAGAGRWEDALPWLEKALEASPPDQAVCEAVVQAALTARGGAGAAVVAAHTRERRCHPTYRLVLLHAMAYARSGRWDDLDKAVRFLQQRNRDEAWRPLAAVLAIVRGDLPRYRELVSGSREQREAMVRQIVGILDEAGRADLAHRLQESTFDRVAPPRAPGLSPGSETLETGGGNVGRAAPF